MPQSFTLTKPDMPAQLVDSSKRAVLVTGAAGRIGSYFAEHSSDKYDLKLMVRESDENVDRLRSFGEVVVCDLADLEGLKDICRNIDTVVHLAGNPEPSATWAELLPPNIIGVYNIFVAAKAAGCRRVIFASSIHAITGYARDIQARTTDPVNPGTLYGVTKCFGEAMARYMSEQEDMSAIAIRIGGYHTMETARDENQAHLIDIFISQDDMNRLLDSCIETGNVQFAIVQGLSDNRFKHMDISDARQLLGYDPQDDMASENPLLRPLAIHNKKRKRDPSAWRRHSGIREDL